MTASAARAGAAGEGGVDEGRRGQRSGGPEGLDRALRSACDGPRQGAAQQTLGKCEAKIKNTHQRRSAQKIHINIAKAKKKTSKKHKKSVFALAPP